MGYTSKRVANRLVQVWRLCSTNPLASLGQDCTIYTIDPSLSVADNLSCWRSNRRAWASNARLYCVCFGGGRRPERFRCPPSLSWEPETTRASSARQAMWFCLVSTPMCCTCPNFSTPLCVLQNRDQQTVIKINTPINKTQQQDKVVLPSARVRMPIHDITCIYINVSDSACTYYAY
jgi:hypothetical protein